MGVALGGILYNRLDRERFRTGMLIGILLIGINMIWKNISRKLWKDPDPDELSIDNAYKTRWVWYHTILGIELLIVILVQLAILVLLAVKL